MSRLKNPVASALVRRSTKGIADMSLAQADFKSYDSDRGVVLFTMKNGDAVVQCAISTSAMDELEKLAKVKDSEREAQFMRLRSCIEKRAARKFLNLEFEGQPSGIILRSIDFQASDRFSRLKG
jgi:hypothetical protein